MNEGASEGLNLRTVSRMVRVTSVGVGDVLNSSPLTDTVLPMAGNLDPEPSSMSVFERVTTLIEVIGGVVPVNNEEVGVRVKLPVLWSMLPTVPVICEGHKRTKLVVTFVWPPLEEMVPGRICTSCPTSRSAPLANERPEISNPSSSPISSRPTSNTALG